MPNDKALATTLGTGELTPIRWGRGVDRYDNSPATKEAPDFSAFARQLRADRAQAKGLQWISGPCGVAPDDQKHRGSRGKPHRCSDCVLPRRWLGFDIDGGLPSEATGLRWVAVIAELFHGLSYFAYTTASHEPDKPRVRIIVELDREVDREEGVRASRARRARADALTALLAEP